MEIVSEIQRFIELMLNPFSITVCLALMCQYDSVFKDYNHYLKGKPYQSPTLNKVITIQDMYNTKECLDKIFMQEEGVE